MGQRNKTALFASLILLLGAPARPGAVHQGPKKILVSPAAAGGGGGSGICAGAAFATDTFTEGSDTALESHTPDLGNGWTGPDVAKFDVIAAVDEIDVDDNSTGYFAVKNDAPASADYCVEVVGRTNSLTSGKKFAALFRMDTSKNGYGGTVSGSGGTGGIWEFNRYATGSDTLLSSGTIAGFSSSTYYTITIQGVGDQISYYLDGVLKATVTDATYSAAQLPGVYIRHTEAHITSLTAKAMS